MFAPQEHHCGKLLWLRLAWRALGCALQLHSPYASGTEGKGLQERDQTIQRATPHPQPKTNPAPKCDRSDLIDPQALLSLCPC